MILDNIQNSSQGSGGVQKVNLFYGKYGKSVGTVAICQICSKSNRHLLRFLQKLMNTLFKVKYLVGCKLQ